MSAIPPLASHFCTWLPFGKLWHSYGTSPFLMGISTISMVIFNSKLLVHQRVPGKQYTARYHKNTEQKSCPLDSEGHLWLWLVTASPRKMFINSTCHTIDVSSKFTRFNKNTPRKTKSLWKTMFLGKYRIWWKQVRAIWSFFSWLAAGRSQI